MPSKRHSKFFRPLLIKPSASRSCNLPCFICFGGQDRKRSSREESTHDPGSTRCANVAVNCLRLQS
jgi:hypothetical protein